MKLTARFRRDIVDNLRGTKTPRWNLSTNTESALGAMSFKFPEWVLPALEEQFSGSGFEASPQVVADDCEQQIPALARLSARPFDDGSRNGPFSVMGHPGGQLQRDAQFGLGLAVLHQVIPGTLDGRLCGQSRADGLDRGRVRRDLGRPIRTSTGRATTSPAEPSGIRPRPSDSIS
jgi:hypothetical protein